MHHYFVASEHDESEYFTFTEKFLDFDFIFKSCPDVFSKDKLDYGSLVLVKSIIDHKEIFSGNIMDMCCGYGTIAILLSKYISAEYFMSDINSIAVELAKENIKLNNTGIDPEDVLVGDMFDGIDRKFHHIVSNPPIKVGKKHLINFVNGAFDHLEEKGTVTLVIKKNLGEESLKSYMTSKFGNCEIWKRDKGYYILHSIKN